MEYNRKKPIALSAGLFLTGLVIGAVVSGLIVWQVTGSRNQMPTVCVSMSGIGTMHTPQSLGGDVWEVSARNSITNHRQQSSAIIEVFLRLFDEDENLIHIIPKDIIIAPGCTREIYITAQIRGSRPYSHSFTFSSVGWRSGFGDKCICSS